MKSVVVVMADGFEEIEAFAVVDILRRADIRVTMAALDRLDVMGSHQIPTRADAVLADIQEPDFDGIILPGGEPGTTHLESSKMVQSLINVFHSNGKLVAAICAAPRILDGIGILNGIPATSYPGTKPKMKQCLYKEDDVVVSGSIVTSRGAGTAMAFAYALVAQLGYPDRAQQLRDAMVFKSY